MPLYATEVRHIRSYHGGIIRYFEKTPKTIVCPHFWELNWAYGCRFECAYCYLQGTFYGNKKPWNRPLSQISMALDTFFHEQKNGHHVLNSGELADSLVYPRLITQISDKFEEQDRHKLLILTKSGNVEPLIDRFRRQTIFSFSLNASNVWKRIEHKTPSPEKRIEAARSASEIGDEVRIRIDPIFPVKDWQAHYRDLIHVLLSKMPNDPDRITLGTPRGLAKTRMFSKDPSWWKLAFEDNPSEDTGWGKKIALPFRKEIYGFFYDQLADLGFDRSRIAMCKETESMWQELGLDHKKCACNCIW